MVTAAGPTIDVRILDHPARVAEIQPFPDGAGAECVFVGRTRRETHPVHGELKRLAYQAYEGLARRTLDDLARQAADRFGCRSVRIHHAIGDVPVGEASVVVQVVTGHRDRAFEACRFLIDRLKAVAPIWKCEVWADGTTWSAGTPVEASS